MVQAHEHRWILGDWCEIKGCTATRRRDHLVAAEYLVEVLRTPGTDVRLVDGWLCDVNVPLVSLDQVAEDLNELAAFGRVTSTTRDAATIRRAIEVLRGRT
jgi:hypothetical protein